MELFAHAGNDWDLDSLYADIASIKGDTLTEWEKTCLRGLLCGYSPEFIASQIFWTASSLRTELSRRLYRYIFDLVETNEKVSYSKVTKWLEDAGYKIPPLQILKRDLLNIENSGNKDLISKDIRALAIIASIKEQMLPNSISASLRFKQVSSQASKLNNLIEQGDKQSKQGNFSNAINFYKNALLIDHSFVGVFIKIARCYDRLKLYKDSLFLCDFVLTHIENKEHKSQVYNFLAGVFHELALYTYRDDYIKSARDLYQEALYYSPLDVLPAWNIIHLFISVFKHYPITLEQHKDYVEKAKLALYNFKSTACRPEFNFKSYRDIILEDAELVCEGLDEWWSEQVNEFKEFGL